MKEYAYAKINISLDVFNVREDGYHDLKSIMVPINFYDEIEINIANKNRYYCDKYYLRFNEHNSVIKMINILKQRFNINDSYEINIKKIIPSRAGLGGGTADAAATLRIFEKLYDLKLSKDEIKDICLAVGADVLFNYYNYPAIVSGMGDEIEPIKIKDKYYVLLVVSKYGVSTKEAFNLLDMNTCEHPNIDRLKVALENGDEITGLLGNSLQQAAFQLNSDIKPAIDLLKENGFENVLMTGSGSAVFALSKDNEKIKQVYDKLHLNNYFVRFTSIL